MTLGTIALLAIAGPACNAVLGLDAPTLDPCANGCTDGAAPHGDDAGPVTGDGTAPVDSPASDAPLDAPLDAVLDRGPRPVPLGMDVQHRVHRRHVHAPV